MIGLSFTLGGPGDPSGTRSITAHLDELPRRLRSALHDTITQLTDELLQRVRAAEPSRTGKLRSLTHSWVQDGKDMVRGGVTVGRDGAKYNVAASALEYGAHRVTRVAEHQQHLSHVFNQAIDSRLVTVRAYARHPNIQARRFLRSPFAAMRPRIQAEIERVIKEQVR
jgi:hypothetical protein